MPPTGLAALQRFDNPMFEADCFIPCITINRRKQEKKKSIETFLLKSWNSPRDVTPL
jgi:hypothetical protein